MRVYDSARAVVRRAWRRPGAVVGTATALVMAALGILTYRHVRQEAFKATGAQVEKIFWHAWDEMAGEQYATIIRPQEDCQTTPRLEAARRLLAEAEAIAPKHPRTLLLKGIYLNHQCEPAK